MRREEEVLLRVEADPCHRYRYCFSVKVGSYGVYGRRLAGKANMAERDSAYENWSCLTRSYSLGTLLHAFMVNNVRKTYSHTRKTCTHTQIKNKTNARQFTTHGLDHGKNTGSKFAAHDAVAVHQERPRTTCS